MAEGDPKPFEILSSKTRTTRGGEVARSTVLIGGKEITIHHSSGDTEAGLADQVNTLQGNQRWLKTPETVAKFNDQGTTPQKYIDDQGQRFATQLKDGGIVLIEDLQFSPAIQERGAAILFEEAGPVNEKQNLFKR